MAAVLAGSVVGLVHVPEGGTLLFGNGHAASSCLIAKLGHTIIRAKGLNVAVRSVL